VPGLRVVILKVGLWLHTLQEPLLNATTGPDGNPFASLLPQAGSGAAAGGSGAAAGGAADQPSSQPLPNPWAPQGGAAGELALLFSRVLA
jgi:hypothetical protein